VKGDARVAWRQMAKMLRDAGIGTALDRHAMLLLVDAWVTWNTSTAALRQSGLLIKAPSGYPLQNPLFAIANKAHEQIVRLLAEFGMTPASRTRIHVELPHEPDPMEAFLT
jgi:P27 family predicted phage terminase small subunit